jgi:hypothetical protein
MSLTPRARYAPGDTITSAWANILDDDFAALDLRTGGDPGAANKMPVSNGTLGSAWQAMADPTLVTDKKVSAHSTGLASFAAAALTGENLLTSSGQSGANVDGPVASDWHVIQTAWVGGNYWLQLAVSIYDVNSAYLRVIVNNAAGPWVKWWHSGNDGSGSGLDADTLRGLVYGNAAGQIPVSNNVVCTQLVASAASTATSATSATTATSAAQLGGVAASSYALRASGTYSGNGAGSRTVSLPFTPILVILRDSIGANQDLLWFIDGSARDFRIDSASGVGNATAFSGTGASLTTNGFIVASAGASNTSGHTYYYEAFG